MLPPPTISHSIMRTKTLSSTSPLARAVLRAGPTCSAQSSRTYFFWHRSRSLPPGTMYHRILKVKLVQASATQPHLSGQYLRCIYWGRNRGPDGNSGDGRKASDSKGDRKGFFEQELSWTDRARRIHHREHWKWREEHLQAKAEQDKTGNQDRPFRPHQTKQEREHQQSNVSKEREDLRREYESVKHQRMAHIKRLINQDPYEAIFGWSNRLRMGLPVRWYTPFEGVDPKTERNASDAQGGSKEKIEVRESVPEQTQSKPVVPVEPLGKDRPAIQKDMTAQHQKTHSSSARPVNLESNQSYLEYDPISNRMIQRRDDAFSHYGQDLDTSVDIPVKAPRENRANDTVSDAITNAPKLPSVPDVPTELRQYKSRRFPYGIAAAINAEEKAIQDAQPSQKAQGVKQDSTDAIERGKLEQSFSQIHSKEAEGVDKSIKKPLSHHKKTATLASTASDQNVQDGIGPNETKASAPDSGYITQLQSTNVRRLLKMEQYRNEVARISAELKAMDERLRSTDHMAAFEQDRYHTMWVLRREQLEREIAKLDTEIEPLETPETSKQPDAGKSSKVNRRSEDVFPLLFGEKPEFKAEEAPRDGGHTVLEGEIEAQKRAMLDVEERLRDEAAVEATLTIPEPSPIETTRADEQIPFDPELVNEIRDVYEQEYGEITAKHYQVQPHKDGAEAPTSSSQATPGSGAVYTVLAYDPATSEVTTTSFHGPVSHGDKPIPLATGLSQLDQPSKFLPHLRLLGDHDFDLVTNTKNILVLRSTVPISPSSGTVAEPEVESTEVKTESPMTKDTPQMGSFPESASPKGEQKQPRAGRIISRRPRRTQFIYTGDKRAGGEEFPRRKQRWGRWAKRTVFWTGFAAGVLYIGGMTSGMSRVVISPDRHNSPTAMKDKGEERRGSN